MSWKDTFKDEFDFRYQFVKSQKSNIRFPCYGGRFWWFLVSRNFENGYFYLADNSLIYTNNGGYLIEIPFDSIKKLKIKQGKLFKNSYQLYIAADKKYHFQINEIKDFSTKMTGNSRDNVRNFLDTLQIRIKF